MSTFAVLSMSLSFLRFAGTGWSFLPFFKKISIICVLEEIYESCTNNFIYQNVINLEELLF
jgi:hypothetical protein